MPAGMSLDIVYDRSQTVRASVHDVKFTLALSLVLVVLVIFVFLRNVRAAIIPSIVIPLSFAGTFAVMYMLGFSIDNLSLMALTLSVGFVVDDAIVMLENVTVTSKHGESPLDGDAEGREGDRLHDRVDDDLARGGVHSGVVHGRHRRTAVPRVRDHDHHRDSDFRRACR